MALREPKEGLEVALMMSSKDITLVKVQEPAKSGNINLPQCNPRPSAMFTLKLCRLLMNLHTLRPLIISCTHAPTDVTVLGSIWLLFSAACRAQQPVS